MSNRSHKIVRGSVDSLLCVKGVLDRNEYGRSAYVKLLLVSQVISHRLHSASNSPQYFTIHSDVHKIVNMVLIIEPMKLLFALKRMRE